MEKLNFGNLKVITSTHYNRPECTRHMIEHLKECEGIEDYILVCGVEPGFPEVIDELNKYPYRRMIYLNDRLLGCWQNKIETLKHGFMLGDYNIHLEDDVILAKDALRYFEWAKKYRHDNTVLSITAYSRDNDIRNPSLVTKTDNYSSIAWAMWREKFEFIVRNGWNGSDKRLAEIYRNKHVSPSVSRAKHIGYSHGVGTHPDLLKQIREHGHEPFAYAGLESVNGGFVLDKKLYIKSLKLQLSTTTDDTIKLALQHQINVAESGQFDRQILVNSYNEEWTKLDDFNEKTKSVSEYFKYENTYWSNDFERVETYYD